MTRYDRNMILGFLELIRKWETEGLPPNIIIEYIDILEEQLKKSTP